MRKLQLPLCGLTLVGLTLAAPLPARAQEAATAPLSAAGAVPSAATIQDLAARIKPALVRLRIIESSTQEGREVRSVSFGSGALISPDGYIVTNHHVAGAARAIFVTLADKREVEAKLVGTDALADLAVVKIEGANYPTISWGDDATLRVGDPVLAFGSPLAISQSVTSGIVSNLELVIFNSSAVTLDDEDTGSIVRWIAHDAAIYPGNSGGPLINARGEMVGVNEIEFGLSGAIPASLARPVVEQLIKKGSIARAYTGLALQPRLKGQGDKGVLVAGVLANSPAQKAGILPGDILLTSRVAGEAAGELDGTFAEQLPAINNRIGAFPVGGDVAVQLQRGGVVKTVTLTPTPRPRAYDEDRELDGWDMTASDISPLVAIKGRLQNVKGALITGVADEGSAGNAKPPLQAGDVVVSINRAPVASLADLQKISDKLPMGQDDVAALVEVARGGERVLSAVRLNRTRIYDASIEVARAWLPIGVQAMTPELAELLKLPDDNAQGVRVTQIILPGSGLQLGDIITMVDDTPVEVEAAEGIDGFWAILHEYNVGTSAKLKVLRDGKAVSVNAKLGREPRAERELPVYFDLNFGLAVRDISYFDRQRGAAGDDQKGVSIVHITQGGWASVAGLHETDLLMAIDGKPTTTLKEAQTALETLAKTKAKTATFFIAHSVDTQFHEVITPWSAR